MIAQEDYLPILVLTADCLDKGQAQGARSGGARLFDQAFRHG